MARKADKTTKRKTPKTKTNRGKPKAPPALSASPETKHEPAKRKQGAPSTYTREIADQICRQLSEGNSLNKVCKAEGMPPRTTVLDWVRNDVDGFSDRYTRAREELLEFWADETLDISDDGKNDYAERTSRSGETVTVFDRENVERSKLRVETRKWLLVKLMPKKYGDKVEQKHTGDVAFVELLKQMNASG